MAVLLALARRAIGHLVRHAPGSGGAPPYVHPHGGITGVSVQDLELRETPCIFPHHSQKKDGHMLVHRDTGPYHQVDVPLG